MPRLLVLFNHTLTSTQIEDARESLGVTAIIYPPEDIRRLWKKIPPETVSVRTYLTPVKAWLSSTSCRGNFVLIQGEFGATWMMVDFAFKSGLVPIYSTTSRKVFENPCKNGGIEIRHIFEHVRYRLYEKSK